MWDMAVGNLHDCKIDYHKMEFMMEMNNNINSEEYGKLENKHHWMHCHLGLQIFLVAFEVKVVVYFHHPKKKTYKTVVHDGRFGDFVFKQNPGLIKHTDHKNTIRLLYNGDHFYYVVLNTK